MTLKTYLQNSRRYLSIIAISAAALLFTACGEEKVATAANEFEANQIYDILHSKGLRVVKKPVEASSGGGDDAKGWNMMVDEGWFGEDEAATAIMLLRDYGLPRLPEPENKSTDSLGIVSDRAQKEKEKRDLQQSVERQLYNFPDVIRASVIIALPTDDILSISKTPPTASVSLVLKETEPKFTDKDVQTQVSGGVPNLKPENVNVTLTKQALREFPLEKLEDKRRSNKIFAIGAGIITLLALSLGAVLMLAKRRQSGSAAETGELTEGENDDILEMPERERALLNAEGEK